MKTTPVKKQPIALPRVGQTVWLVFLRLRPTDRQPEWPNAEIRCRTVDAIDVAGDGKELRVCCKGVNYLPANVHWTHKAAKAALLERIDTLVNKLVALRATE